MAAFSAGLLGLTVSPLFFPGRAQGVNRFLLPFLTLLPAGGDATSYFVIYTSFTTLNPIRCKTKSKRDQFRQGSNFGSLVCFSPRTFLRLFLGAVRQQAL